MMAGEEEPLTVARSAVVRWPGFSNDCGGPPSPAQLIFAVVSEYLV